jgi:hypothetical protein
VERAVAKSAPGEPVLVEVGEMATMAGAFDLAEKYLGQALAVNQESGQANLMLGIVAAKQEDLKTAEKRWRTAEKLARQSRDSDLLERVQRARKVYTGPMKNLFHMMAGGDFHPDMLKQMPPPAMADLIELISMIDEDDDDDFGY